MIHIPAVPFAIRLDDKVGYIPLQRFNENASQEVANALRTLKRQGASAFILDLRGNTGGSLEAAVDISDLFLQPGQTIVTVRYRSQPTDEYKAQGRPVVEDEPLVVLVDGYSASASEIVAGALQDHDRAVVVGTTTFGKGLVQILQIAVYAGNDDVAALKEEFRAGGPGSHLHLFAIDDEGDLLGI